MANPDLSSSAVRELAVSVDNQNTALIEVAGQIRNLKGSEARSRNFLRLLAVTLLFDICLSIGLGFIAFRSNNASTQAKRSIRVSCVAGNDVRSEELALWSYVLASSSAYPPPNETAAQHAARLQQVADFREVLKRTFAPRDCTKV